MSTTTTTASHCGKRMLPILNYSSVLPNPCLNVLIPPRLLPHHPTPVPNSTLSSGTIAAIVVSVVVMGALVTGAAFWFLARRRRSLKLGATSKPGPYSDKAEQGRYSPVLIQKPELDALDTSVNGVQQYQKYTPQPIMELPSERYD